MKLLLHICCAVCATVCVERLRQQSCQVTGYFYNPNIHPREEYLQRLQQTEELARRQDFPLIAGDYDVESWYAKIRGLEDEPEGGRRCLECFRLRLEQTAAMAEAKGCSAFTTTLTVSPHKNAQAINEIGEATSRCLFLVSDFKKQDGFKKAQELSRKYRLYHQHYCGCVFSLEERRAHERIHQKTGPCRHLGQTA